MNNTKKLYKCQSCGEIFKWDASFVLPYGFSGDREYMRCPECFKFVWRKVEKFKEALPVAQWKKIPVVDLPQYSLKTNDILVYNPETNGHEPGYVWIKDKNVPSYDAKEVEWAAKRNSESDVWEIREMPGTGSIGAFDTKKNAAQAVFGTEMLQITERAIDAYNEERSPTKRDRLNYEFFKTMVDVFKKFKKEIIEGVEAENGKKI